MPMDSLDDFKGFFLEGGEIIPIENSAKILTVIREHWKAPNREIYGTLFRLYMYCLQNALDATPTAHTYIEEMLLYAELPEQRAHCLLCLGQLKEREGAYKEALEVYSSAFDLTLERSNDFVRYFLNNNLGYCLNFFGRHTEAEQYCRAAIETNPARYNAFKNLGVALQGQGKYTEAAEAFVRSAQINPWDQRALWLLEELLSQEKDNLLNITYLMDKFKGCRELAEKAVLH